MSIRELIPAVVEEIVEGVRKAEETGVTIVPAAIPASIEMRVSDAAVVRVDVQIFPRSDFPQSKP